MKRNLILLFMLLAGIIFGALFASITADIPFLSWLSFGDSVGIATGDPMILDLSVLKLALGFELRVNIAQIICVILSIFAYKALIQRL